MARLDVAVSIVAVFRTARFRSTVPPFHRSTVPPFHRSTVPPFHRSTVPPFHRSTVPPSHPPVSPRRKTSDARLRHPPDAESIRNPRSVRILHHDRSSHCGRTNRGEESPHCRRLRALALHQQLGDLERRQIG